MTAAPLAQFASLGLGTGAGRTLRRTGCDSATIVRFVPDVFNLVRADFSNIAILRAGPGLVLPTGLGAPSASVVPNRCTIGFVRAVPTEPAVVANAPAENAAPTEAPAPSQRPVLGPDEHLAELGVRIRGLRAEQGLTLQAVADRTGLSSSMVSMVERGRTSPSIGTLIAIASALGVHMSELFELDVDGPRDAVQRAGEQQVVEAADGVLRRLVQVDPRRGLELVVNEYAPGTASALQVTHHTGHEYGFVLEGVLTVELQNASHRMEPGDSIAFESTRPHRIVNTGSERARAVWVNLSPRGTQPDIVGDNSRGA